MSAWIAVDFDGTLAHYAAGSMVEQLGAPIPLMVERVKDWLSKGHAVRIFTARVGNSGARNEHGTADDAAFVNEREAHTEQALIRQMESLRTPEAVIRIRKIEAASHQIVARKLRSTESASVG